MISDNICISLKVSSLFVKSDCYDSWMSEDWKVVNPGGAKNIFAFSCMKMVLNSHTIKYLQQIWGHPSLPG